MAKLKTRTCHTCGGSGTLPDGEVGPQLRVEREKHGITAVDMAAYCGISPAFLFDLERDNRRWTNEVYEKYLKGLGELRNGATV